MTSSRMVALLVAWICLQTAVADQEQLVEQPKPATSKAESVVQDVSPAAGVNFAAHKLMHPHLQLLQEIISDDDDTSSSSSSGASLMEYVVYVILVCIFAFWYRSGGKDHFVPSTDSIPLLPGQDRFNSGLFQCCDEPALTCVSLCCGPVRWADTMNMAGQMGFGLALAMYLGIYGLNYILLPGSLILACICAHKRQKLREHFMMPYGSCGSACEDFLTYLCCPCCAIVQEARQVEAYSVEGVLKATNEIVGEPTSTSRSSCASCIPCK